MIGELPLNARVFVTGHRGLVGSSVVRRLNRSGLENILVATRRDLDLRDQGAVDGWFEQHRPEYVIHVAGTVGGIGANSKRPADFLYDNLLIHATVLRAAWQNGVTKLLYLGSSCTYPRDCPQPIKEEYMLSGPLEVTNQAYAIAKIAGVMSCAAYRQQHGCNFISAMPTNTYGPHDRFSPDDSHVLPALLYKFHRARVERHNTVTLWGSGNPRREFLYVDDLADACLFLLTYYDEAETVNVGCGSDLSIAELANDIREVVHPQAEIEFDTSRPDGTPRKLLDVSKLNALGWQHRTSLKSGIEKTYQWFLQNCA